MVFVKSEVAPFSCVAYASPPLRGWGGWIAVAEATRA